MFGKVKSGRSCRVFLVKMASFFFPSKQSKAQIVKKTVQVKMGRPLPLFQII